MRKLFRVGILLVSILVFNGIVSIAAPNFYRSLKSGDWSTPGTWESSADNISWIPATAAPSSADNAITIRNGHTISVSNSVSLDETTIAGNLQVLTGGVLTINNGLGNDVDIQNNGVLQILSTSAYAATIIQGTSVINISTGGKIIIGNGSGAVGAGYEAFAAPSTNMCIWNDASVFEWNTLSTFLMSGLTYFPSASASIPIFRITKVSGIPNSGSSGVTINGILEVNTDVTLAGGSNKIFRNGIRGTATLTQNNTTSNGFTLTAANAILDGAALKIVLSFPLILSTNTIVPVGANVTLSGANINNSSKSLTVNGILDVTTVQITNPSGTVTINGIYKTAHPGGFSGTGSSIPSLTGTVNLNSGSTVEYNALGDQVVTSRSDYENITFSGSGNKTPSNSFTPTGTVYITGFPILDASNHNIVTTSPNTTNLKMDGGRFILGTISTQPGMEGIYNLTGGVVQFNNSQLTAQTIRSGKDFYNIEVTGNNVGNSNSNLLLASGGSLTVKNNGIFTINDNSIHGATGTQTVTIENGGTFRCGNNEGFNGFASTFTNFSSIHQNIENILLNTGSTVEYMRSGDQPITNANGLVYSNLLISGSGNKTAPVSILTIGGNLTKSGTGTFVHNSGSVLFDGGTTAQNYTANSEILFNNLANNNLNTVIGLSVNNNLAIAGQLTLNANSKITLASGNVTLKSSAAATANVAEIPSGASISYGAGLFVVERYIPALRAWRFLSVPVNSLQTIHEAWQENQLPNNTSLTGLGIQITSNRSTWSADGFDLLSPGGPSMKTYDPATNSYVGITTTFASFASNLGGYMTFIRGDRTANTVNSAPTQTVLRATGKLFTGTQSSITVGAGQFTPVNNPYASRLQLSKLNKSAQFFFYVWDPKLGTSNSYGFGAFQALSWNLGKNNYDVVPGGGSYGSSTDYIESGQSFFTSFALGGNLTIQENAKAGGSSLVFTPNQIQVSTPQLRTNLYGINSNGSAFLTDGILNSFADDYSNDVDEMDAVKMRNSAENLAVKTGGKLLAIERRHTVTQNDTIFLNLTGARVQTYRLEFIANDINNEGIEGLLEDNYLLARTPLNLSGTTLVNFTINNDAGSSASNRFRIVFTPLAVLPVTITNIKAYMQNKDIAVEWNVNNEGGIQQYEIEKSVDANSFLEAGVVAAKNISVSNYKWLDVNAVTGYNYYRIRIVDLDGKIKYTDVVKVLIDKLKPAITIYPNPIINGIINLQLINQPAGEYNIRLLNKLGQVIVSKQVNHAGGSSTEIITWNYNLLHGIYQLEVIQPDGNKKDINLIY